METPTTKITKTWNGDNSSGVEALEYLITPERIPASPIELQNKQERRMVHDIPVVEF